METAVLDAAVLFRGGVHDFLLWVAEAGAFSPVWSDLIHDEWMRSRRAKFGDPDSPLERARREMERAFPGANFDPDSNTLTSLHLPDPEDVHVVATAVASEANVIVTYNERHFPEEILGPLRLAAETPDLFCVRPIRENAPPVIEGARLHRASLKKPPFARREYLDHLAGLDLKETATLLRAWQHLV